MRFDEPLTYILNNETKVVILRLLCRYPTSISGRQLAKIVNVNPTTVNKALNGLIAEQIILVRKAGNACLYELNTTNWVVAKLLIPLFKQEGELLNEFVEKVSYAIKQSFIRKELITVALFGSVYEREEKPTSDVDLFIVVKEAKYKKMAEDLFFDIGSNLILSIGMTIEPYVKTVAEFRRDRELNVVKSILKSHRVIWGQKLEKVI